MNEFKTPVAFFTFNRLETTKKVFEAIRQAKPPKLYLISDGPRSSRKGEADKVQAVREYMESNIDWECEVYKNYAPQNLGCGRRVSSGISWVFEQEEEAIILEDDCLPDESFFMYCQEMLEYYRDDERIMVISGNNPIADQIDVQEEYLFSKVPYIWGWASWRRAWKLYDFDILDWPKLKKEKRIRKWVPIKTAWMYEAEFDALYKHKYDTWDYQWTYAVIMNDKYAIAPPKSYTQNIGVGMEATHTTADASNVEQGVASRCKFPIEFRENVVWDKEFDKAYFAFAGQHGLTVKIKSLLRMDINKSIKEILKR